MSIGGLDFSGCLKSLVLNDAAWERGLCPTSGTLTLVAGSAPETLDDLDNPRFYRGQSVIVEVEGERHPRGALRIISATYNGGELALEVGCLLSLLSYRQPTNPDTAGVSLGTATSLLTVATNLLNAAGITAIAITGASDTTIHYPPSVSGSYISSAAEILYSLGNVGWIDNQEVLQIVAVDPQPTSADTTMQVGVDCKDPVRNRGLELPPEEVVATGQSVIVKTRTTPYQLDKSTEYADAATLHPERSGITPVRVTTINESQDGAVVTRTTSEDLARGLIGQGLELEAGGITTLIANAQRQEEVYTYEPGLEGRLLKYQRRIYRANGLAIPTWFSWHKQKRDSEGDNPTSSYWSDADGNPGIGQLQVTTGSVLAERETKTYVYTDGIPSKVTTTLEMCEGEVLGDIDVKWDEWLDLYGLPTTLKTDTVTTEEWIELRPGTWQKITSVQRAAGRQQPQRFEGLEGEDQLTLLATFGTALGAIATTTELSNSGQLNPPAPERRPPTHFQETNQGSARYRFPQNGGTYQERQSTISVPYLPSETRTDKPGKRFYGSGDSARAMLERSAYLDGAVKIARAKGSRVDARLTHGLMQGYRPLMTCDVTYPGGAVRRFGVDATTWVLTQTECLVSFNGLYWGTVQEGGVLQLPYQRVGVLAGGLRYGGRLELLPYSLEPVAIALLGGLRYGGQLSQSFNASFNLLSGYRYGGNLNIAEQNLERLRSGYLYGGNLMLSSVFTRLRSGYEYGGRLNIDTGSDPATAALLAAFTGSYDTARQAAIDDLITGLKSDGIWAKLDVLSIVGLNQADSLVNWKTPGTFNGTVSGTMSFTADRGLTGNGSTGFVNTNFNPATAGGHYSQDSASVHAYSRTNQANEGSDVDVLGGPPYLNIVARYSDNNLYFNLNSGSTGFTGISGLNTAGLLSLSRIASDTASFYRNGSLVIDKSETSSGMPNSTIRIAGQPGFYTTRQYAAWAIGGGLNATEVANLNSRIATYLTYIGANV